MLDVAVVRAYSLSVDQLWHFIISVIGVRSTGRCARHSRASSALLSLVLLGDAAETGHGLGSELVQDSGDELSELFLLASAVNGEGVGTLCGVNWGVEASIRQSKTREAGGGRQ